MPDFALRKWYLDVADDKGDVYIGYSVSMKWGRFELDGFQHLWRSFPKGVETQTRIARQPVPEYKANDRLIWRPNGVQAVWESVCEPIKETLLDTEAGRIEWLCTQPKARASVNSSRLSFSGWGYTECIDITVPVWRLPFKTLYWGRCHTNDHYLVWIRWDGKTRQSLIWLDGKCSQDYNIEDGRIVGPSFVLKLGEDVPLRQGMIASTIFQPFSRIVRGLPRTTFMVDERKWYSKGILETGLKAESAVVIYEEVRW